MKTWLFVLLATSVFAVPHGRSSNPTHHQHSHEHNEFVWAHDNNDHHDFSWVRGVNYVPSTSHNDIATWYDYDRELVQQELTFAKQSGFNAVRVFMSC